jgi:hypothetical protein
MRKKQKVDLTVALLLTAFALIVLTLPLFGINKIKPVIITTFAFYAIINLIRFMVLFGSKDYEGLHYTLSSLCMLFTFLAIRQPSPRNLALVVFGWVALNSLAKLKKADYYNDRRDRMYKFGLLDLVIFLLTGIICCVNLSYPGDVQILIIGFFLLVNGVLEVFDPIIKSLIAHR